MATRGWKLAIGARRADRLAETAEKAAGAGRGGGLCGRPGRDRRRLRGAFFEASEAAVGVADVIVNNAGASRFHWIAETDTRWLRSEIETNLIGPMVVTHRALAPLLAAGTDGDVVMMSSDAARRPRPGQLAYGASKAGLENYAEALSLALEGTGIRVIKVRLGPALSEFAMAGTDARGDAEADGDWASFGLRDARMLAQGNLGILKPDDVARAVVHAVTQPRHVLVDTIELQPSVPRRAEASR